MRECRKGQVERMPYTEIERLVGFFVSLSLFLFPFSFFLPLNVFHHLFGMLKLFWRLSSLFAICGFLHVFHRYIYFVVRNDIGVVYNLVCISVADNCCSILLMAKCRKMMSINVITLFLNYFFEIELMVIETRRTTTAHTEIWKTECGTERDWKRQRKVESLRFAHTHFFFHLFAPTSVVNYTPTKPVSDMMLCRHFSTIITNNQITNNVQLALKVRRLSNARQTDATIQILWNWFKTIWFSLHIVCFFFFSFLSFQFLIFLFILKFNHLPVLCLIFFF